MEYMGCEFVLRLWLGAYVFSIMEEMPLWGCSGGWNVIGYELDMSLFVCMGCDLCQSMNSNSRCWEVYIVYEPESGINIGGRSPFPQEDTRKTGRTPKVSRL